MTVLNAFNCLTASGNTGISACALDVKNIEGCIIMPVGTIFTAEQLADAPTLIAALKAATLSAKSTRIYPVNNFVELKDNSEKPIIQTFGYGGKAVVREGYMDWTAQWTLGGLCLSKQLRKFNKRNCDVFFFDSTGMLFGVKNGTGLQGISMTYIYTAPFTVNDGSKATAYTIQFVFKPDFIDSIGFAQLDIGDLDEVIGIQDVVLASGAARVANVSKVTGSFSCGGQDLYDLYSAELAAPGMWIVTDSVTGLPIAITGVAANATINGWTITVDAADPNYVVGHAVNISLATASVLNAAGILSVEQSNVFVTPN